MDSGALATVTERAVIVLLDPLSVTSGIGNTKHFASPGKTSPKKDVPHFPFSFGKRGILCMSSSHRILRWILMRILD